MKTTAFLFRVGVCIGLSLIPAQDLEHQLYGFRFKWRGRIQAASTSPVVIVELDSDQGYGGWDPATLDATLQRILVQDPAAVAVTWFIPETEAATFPPEAWGPRIRDPRVLWSGHLGPDGDPYPPPDHVRHRDNWGFNTPLKDSDGVVRRYQLRSGSSHSLVLAIARTAGMAESRLKPMMHETPWINWVGPRGTIPSCDGSRLRADGSAPGCPPLQGKVVLVTTRRDPSLYVNAFSTPVGDMSLAEILGNSVDTVLRERRVYYAPWPVVLLLILAMIIGAAFYIIYYPVVLSALAVTGTGGLLIFGALQALFYWTDVYVPSINIGLSLLVSYLIFTGYRMEVLENLQWRSLKKAQYLRELDEMKSNFLSLLSHDIKTPVAKIQTVVRKLRKEEGAEPNESLDSIENSATELKNTIESILSLSRIEAQKITLNRKSNDINRIIQEALTRFTPMAQQKGISFETNLEPLFAVECDEDLIRQVLSNLIDNAIKYSPASSKVVIRSREEKNAVRVDVVDSGPGIPKDQLPLMFRKFSRVHRGIKGQPKGTGLGLYLSKYFINLHGGTIRFRTREGRGTIFTFILPVGQT
ncbi:MAG TPA: ATP-binding protein [Bdellovibrionota bacterium]|nr:ATP-binding protein [Bdellovibrionota bacterium]